jgi:anti-anti-sigma factor
LGVEVEALDESIAVARVRGEVDMSTTGSLLERLLPAAESGPLGLAVDLTHVAFMGAAGIHALEEVKASLARRGGKLAVIAPGGIPLRVLEVTRLKRTLGVVPTLDAARIALGAGP